MIQALTIIQVLTLIPFDVGNNYMFNFVSISLPILGISFAVLSIVIKKILLHKGYPITYFRTSIIEVVRFRKFINEKYIYRVLYYTAMFVLWLVLVEVLFLFLFIGSSV